MFRNKKEKFKRKDKVNTDKDSEFTNSDREIL